MDAIVEMIYVEGDPVMTLVKVVVMVIGIECLGAMIHAISGMYK